MLESATILKIIFALLGALLIAWFQYFYKIKKEGQLNYWLSFLRFTAIFSVFLLLINPSIKKKTLEIEKPKLFVAIDDSESILFNNNDSIVKRYFSELKNNKNLNTKFDIHFYEFGTHLKPLDSLSFKEVQSNLAKPFKEISKLQEKDGEFPLVVISDGIQTIGTSVEFQDYKGKVFPVIVGDTTSIEDIRVEKIINNKFTFIKNRFPVEIFVSYFGKKKVEKKLTVSLNNKIVFTKNISFSKSNSSDIISFFLQANQKGKQHYFVKIEALENEKNVQNNSKYFSIEVIEEKAKILLVSDISHPDVGMLKKSIESNKGREVTFKNTQNKNINYSLYQLVVLYQPNSKFNNIFKAISNYNLNYFVISGKNTDWNFLNEVQTNFSKNTLNTVELFKPVYNNSFDKYMSDDIGFSSFPPLTDFFGEVKFNVPKSDLLFQKIGTIETAYPMLSVFESDNIKTGVLFGEDIWRWRMSSFSETNSFEKFDSFIANLMQYLVSNSKNNRLNIDVNDSYFTNDEVNFTALYFDENLNFDNRAKLWLSVSNKKSGYFERIPLAIQNDKYVTTLSNLNSGEYTYEVSIENQKVNKKGNFIVLPYVVEELTTQSNFIPLSKIAKKTKGKIFYNTITPLIDLLQNETNYKPLQKEKITKTPLIDWRWILAIIIVALSTEWFVRKYFGKI